MQPRAALRVFIAWLCRRQAPPNPHSAPWLLLGLSPAPPQTRWLPEHPGGQAIIPRQSLNLDCARQFELYHASRESFIYLRQFYMVRGGRAGVAHRCERCDAHRSN